MTEDRLSLARCALRVIVSSSENAQVCVYFADYNVLGINYACQIPWVYYCALHAQWVIFNYPGVADLTAGTQFWT